MLKSPWIQLSDFGLAVANGIQNNKSIKLSGTLGYVAPEYLVDGMSLLTIISFRMCYVSESFNGLVF